MEPTILAQMLKGMLIVQKEIVESKLGFINYFETFNQSEDINIMLTVNLLKVELKTIDKQLESLTLLNS